MSNGEPKPGAGKPPQPAPATPTAAPHTSVVVLGYLAVVAFSFIAAGLVLDEGIEISLSVKTDDFEWFAVLYVAAQAIERLLEPIMGMIKSEPAAVAKSAVATAAEGPDKALKQTELAQVQADRAVIAWAIASSLALVLCGFLHLGILESLATVSAEGSSKEAFEVVNVIITGLVIGAGTKPLHDLISRIEKSKEKADPKSGA